MLQTWVNSGRQTPSQTKNTYNNLHTFPLLSSKLLASITGVLSRLIYSQLALIYALISSKHWAAGNDRGIKMGIICCKHRSSYFLANPPGSLRHVEQDRGRDKLLHQHHHITLSLEKRSNWSVLLSGITLRENVYSPLGPKMSQEHLVSTYQRQLIDLIPTWILYVHPLPGDHWPSTVSTPPREGNRILWELFHHKLLNNLGHPQKTQVDSFWEMHGVSGTQDILNSLPSTRETLGSVLVPVRKDMGPEHRLWDKFSNMNLKYTYEQLWPSSKAH